MSIIKSFAVGLGDMFYIRHNSDNFSIIDCSLSDLTSDTIISELEDASRDTSVVRFISTHPDNDHIDGLCELDDAMEFRNFYCVDNRTTKPDWTADFERYGELRDHSKKAFHIYKGCRRRWMNRRSDERGSSGINVLWPDTSNTDYQAQLVHTAAGGSPNNISCIIRYSLANGPSTVWMGDLEEAFMERVEDEVDFPKTDILFAPHHGRDTPPTSWLEAMDPGIVVLGEGAVEDLDDYAGYNKIHQRLAGDITLECLSDRVHVYVSSTSCSVDFLDDDFMPDTYGKYIGTLRIA